jgi:hypothetical protein
MTRRPQDSHADLGLVDDDETEDLRPGVERPRAAIAAEHPQHN